jgi:hypothetical protein
MAEAKRFELVQDDEEPAASSIAPGTSDRATDILLLSLQTVSKRTLIALSNLFCLLTVGSVFVLFYSIVPAPNTFQIVSATIYAVFVLAANAIVRRM